MAGKKISIFTLLLTGILLSIFFGNLAQPVRAVTLKKIVILDLPRFDLSEISSRYPHLYHFLGESTVGLLPFNKTTSPNPANAYLYFNSGVVFKSPQKGCDIYDADEPVQVINPNSQKQPNPKIQSGLIYRSVTGTQVAADKAVNIDMAALLNTNNDLNGSLAEFLGEIAHHYSCKTAAIGNSDADKPDRASAAIVMDGKGVIDWGAVGMKTLLPDPKAPFSVRSNPGRIIKYFEEFNKKADLIVVTLGDLERIEKLKDYLNDRRKAYFRKIALKRYDALLGQLLRKIDFNSTQVILVSCLPPEELQVNKEGLTPVAIKGPGFSSGLLFSPTTRKPGIITYNDLRVFVMRYLNPKSSTTEWGLTAVTGTWKDIGSKQAGLIQNYAMRWPLLIVYGCLLIGMVLFLGITLAGNFNKGLIRILYLIYLFLLTIPATFLLEALINPLSWSLVLFLTFSISGVLFLLSYFLSKGDLPKILGWNALITVVIILIDLLFNGSAEMKSFFGYSATSGARFYGIGNEYFGVLLGAIIVLASLNLKKIIIWPKNLLWLIIVLIGLILFHPLFGAKVGGGLTAIISLGIMMAVWFHRPVRFKYIAKLITFAVLILCIMGTLDYYINSSHMTHLGQLISGVKEKGFGIFLALVIRKFELNWSLVQGTPISFVLIGILVTVPFLYKYPPTGIKSFVKQNQDMAAGFTGLCITALIALILNDTGIVAAATMFMYGVMLIILPLIKRRDMPKED